MQHEEEKNTQTISFLKLDSTHPEAERDKQTIFISVGQ